MKYTMGNNNDLPFFRQTYNCITAGAIDYITFNDTYASIHPPNT